MISNERQSPYGHGSGAQTAGKSAGNEETLRSEKLQIERKTFVFTLKENPRGRFLRITEDVAGRRDTIIVPAPGLEDFRKMVEEMARSAGASPEEGAEGEG
jgi:hypothetical protein